MADKQSTKPPSGTRDFLPNDVRKREYVIGVIRGVFERYGFEPLETPAFENIGTLLGKYGDEGNKLIFKILKRGEHEQSGEADLALRYDLTVPLARVVAQYQNELPKFFKRYQIQPVWRADRPARGRFREFCQCDIDSVGSTSTVVEAEQLGAVSEVLTRLGFSDFTIRLNHRKLLPIVLKRDFDILQDANHAQALVALDKLDKVGEEGVAQELSDRGLTTRARALEGLKRAIDSEEVIELRESTRKLALEGLKRALKEPESTRQRRETIAHALKIALMPPEPNDLSRRIQLQALKSALATPELAPSVCEQALQTVDEILATNIDAESVQNIQRDPGTRTAVARLAEIVRLCSNTPAAGKLMFDPFLARGLSYYTSAIMEISVEGIGSLGGGGRYDNLVGMFLGRDVPACGFSLGLERIIVVMTERNMFPPAIVGGIDILVTLWNDGSQADALALADELRVGGLRVEIYPEPDKLGKQFKYASSRNAPFVAIVGDDERARGEVAIKDLRTGDQTPVSRAGAAAFVHQHLAP